MKDDERIGEEMPEKSEEHGRRMEEDGRTRKGIIEEDLSRRSGSYGGSWEGFSDDWGLLWMLGEGREDRQRRKMR